MQLPHLMTPIMHQKFRLRFRMPYSSFLSLVNEMKVHPLFQQWWDGRTDCCGNPSSPIELLLLGALRYIGRKCTFDCLEEVSFISRKTHERFFRAFITYGATDLYDKYVVTPETIDEAKSHMHEMCIAGFDGAIGSMDATHVIIENCRFGVRISHLGHKLKKTARSYNIVVNHRRRILSSTGGHPSTWNDKTLVLFDDFLTRLRKGEILSENDFELLEETPDGEIVRVRYKGVWILVDNGYHKWSLTIPPFKHVSGRKELRFSQWLESMRKDVECTFGILKKRFQILDKGVQGQNLDDADNVWKTCCALHNMLLEVDGNDELWQDEELMTDNGNATCFALRRLVEGETNVRFAAENTSVVDYSQYRISNEVIDVRTLTFEEMRSRLVNHFDIRFRHGGIKWPKKVKLPEVMI